MVDPAGIWRLTALTLAALFTALAACADVGSRPQDSPAPSAPTCGAGDIGGDVISRLEVEVLEEGKAKATYLLRRDAEVGILVSRRPDDGTSRLVLMGRVPFGPQPSRVVNEETFDLPRPNGQPLEVGEYEFTLRAFEAGRLNQGEPIDTRSDCVVIR